VLPGLSGETYDDEKPYATLTYANGGSFFDFYTVEDGEPARYFA